MLLKSELLKLGFKASSAGDQMWVLQPDYSPNGVVVRFGEKSTLAAVVDMNVIIPFPYVHVPSQIKVLKDLITDKGNREAWLTPEIAFKHGFDRTELPDGDLWSMGVLDKIMAVMSIEEGTVIVGMYSEDFPDNVMFWPGVDCPEKLTQLVSLFLPR